jgi:cell division protein ZapA (FtsZ GTPase activity inhibitor)
LIKNILYYGKSELLLELLNMFNTIMEETREELPEQPKDTIAIIAALNIAYDLFVEKINSENSASSHR